MGLMSNNQSNGNNQKPKKEPKQKSKKKKGGFGIFSKKNKNKGDTPQQPNFQQPPMPQNPHMGPPNQQRPMQQPMQQPMQHPQMQRPPMQNQPVQQPPRTGGFNPATNKGNLKGQQAPPPIPRPSNNDGMGGYNHQQLLSGPNPTNYSKALDGAGDSTQTIFLYASPTNFAKIHKYYSDYFEDLVIVGISDSTKVYEEYENKINVGNVLLFIETSQELFDMFNFIELLIDNKKRNPDNLTICILVPSDFDVNYFGNFQDIQQRTNLKRLKTGFDVLDSSALDSIISIIINKQPSYVESDSSLSKPPEPAKQKKVITANTLINFADIDAMKEEIGKIRSTVNQESLVKQINDSFSTAKSVNDVDNIIDLFPEMDIINKYSEELDDYLELLVEDETIDPKLVNEAIINKLSLTLEQENVLNYWFDKALEVSERAAKNAGITYNNKTENRFAKLGDLSIDENEENRNNLLKHREELKIGVENDLKEYERYVASVSNGIVLRRNKLNAMQNEIRELIASTEHKLDERVIDMSEKMVEVFASKKESGLDIKEENERRLSKLISKTNGLFQQYQIIIKIDDVLIDMLLEENDELKKSSTVVEYVVDTPLKSKGRLITIVNDKFVRRTGSMWIRPGDLVVTTFTDLKYPERVTPMQFREYVNSEIETLRGKQVVFLNPSDLEMENDGNYNLQVFKDKLNTLSRDYRRMIFMFDEKEDEVISKFSDDLITGLTVSNTERDNLLIVNNINRRLEKHFANITNLFYDYGDETVNIKSKEIKSLTGYNHKISQTYFPINPTKDDLKGLVSFMIKL